MRTFTKPIFRVLSLSIVTAALSMTTSCNKDDSPAPGPDMNLACKMMKTADNDGDNAKFEYDSKDRISKITSSYDGDEETTVYEYDNNNRVVKVSYYYEDELEETLTVESNANGQWTKLTYKETGSTDQDIFLAEYDGNGNRTKITEKGENDITNYTHAYEYANGNLMKETSTYYFNGSTSVSTTTYEYYTDKEDKLKPIKELLSMGYSGTTSKNLIKKSTYNSSGFVSVDNYTYEYNDKSFPTKITTSDSNSSETESLEYQCK